MAGFRVTYATLTADDAALEAAYTAAVESVRADLGATHPLWIGDDERFGETFTTVSPLDNSVAIGHFTLADGDDVDDAVEAARAARHGWAATPWQQRCEILDRAADLISERSVVDGAALAWENGKSRLEAIGEVEEAADLIRYYTHAMREHDGFDVPMQRFSELEVTTDVMRPYGVWAVIAPFNYPSALVAGPAGAALVAGNTCIIKPSEIGSLSGHLVYRALVEAGVPLGAVNIVTGGGDVGAALVNHPGVDGLTFTGSSAIGMSIIETFSTSHPKPAICEMGGKNPVIVAASADLDLAVEGTARSAFGFGGQKCSAASRVVRRTSRSLDEFVARLVARVAAIPSTSPLDPGGFLSPVVNAAALERYDAVIADVTAHGEVLCGGTRLTDGHHAGGNYVAPTVVRAPDDSPGVDHRTVPPAGRGARRRIARRGARVGQCGAVRADRRACSPRTRPRSTRSSTGSRPAWCTSTAPPGRPPARGRGCSRSAAGSVRAPRARPAAARTTSSSTCASSRAPTSCAGRDSGEWGFRTGAQLR